MADVVNEVHGGEEEGRIEPIEEQELGSNKRRRTAAGSKDAGKCFRCDEPGHLQASCPRVAPVMTGFQINRDELCPALLRVFTAHGSLHRGADFDGGRFPPNETKVHFWPDSTVREVFQAVRGKSNLYRGINVEVTGAVVYLTNSGRHAVRHIFDFHSGNPGQPVTFAELGVEPGDFLSIGILKPGTVTSTGGSKKPRKSGGTRRDRGRRGDSRRDDRREHGDSRRGGGDSYPPRDRDDRYPPSRSDDGHPHPHSHPPSSSDRHSGYSRPN